MVFYFSNKEPKHTGKIISINSDTIEIESSWGERVLFRRTLWYVPTSYGNEIIFFKSIALQETEKHYIDFTKIESKSSK